uniref:thiopeptide maturation pyridine synthase n=1 Tax=Nonomuraea pusilla TaxID=46177 RepID=UPI0006E142A0|nr:thiopeptide maturation pyridine synthase [Nonomuraea pusilla]
MSWQSFHVHYHGSHDDLVLDGIRPLFARLHGLVEAAYYTRHWKLGPHVRVNVRPSEEVGPVVEEVIGGFLKERPSTAALDPERYLDLHRRLAELEAEPGPLFPWRPDNSLHRADYEWRLEPAGGRPAAELLADFYTATTPLSFRMVDGVRRGERRLAIAFELLTALAHSLSGVGIMNGFVSFRSHAEAFLELHAEGRGLRAKWDAFGEQNSAHLQTLLSAALSSLDGGTGSHASEWAAALAPFRSRAAQLIESGQLSMDPGASLMTSRWSGSIDDSPFHRELYATRTWSELRGATWFQVFRLLTNYTYLQLTRLGVNPAERYLLCHLIAGLVEARYGMTALEVASMPLEQVPAMEGTS